MPISQPVKFQSIGRSLGLFGRTKWAGSCGALLGTQGDFLRFKLVYKLGCGLTRLLVAGLIPEPLIAVDDLVE